MNARVVPLPDEAGDRTGIFLTFTVVVLLTLSMLLSAAGPAVDLEVTEPAAQATDAAPIEFTPLADLLS